VAVFAWKGGKTREIGKITAKMGKWSDFDAAIRKVASSRFVSVIVLQEVQESIMEKITGVGAIACAVLFASNAFAASGDMPGDMIVRVRAVELDFNNSSSPLAGITTNN
jgi:hypothetical protein